MRNERKKRKTEWGRGVVFCFVPALCLALSLLLAACGDGEGAAATMRLIKTEGKVRVEDARGKSVEVAEDLGLYSGYGVATKGESYGWINLDDAKLAKMDEESAVEVRKQGKLLELYVRYGSVFFNVTEPLAEDETFDIRTSTMAVGIRGTCGWVEVENENQMRVYLLKGKVECSILDEDGEVLVSRMISAGETAGMSLDEWEASITVSEFDGEEVPEFVREEAQDYVREYEREESPQEEPQPAGTESEPIWFQPPESGSAEFQPPEQEAVEEQEPQALEELPDEYVGEYTHRGSESAPGSITLLKDGSCEIGGGVPFKLKSIVQQGDGSIKIRLTSSSFSTDIIFELSPADEGAVDLLWKNPVSFGQGGPTEARYRKK